MTFLAPIPAIIAAAITVPALLVLYFLKLRRRPVRVSSTMLWVARTRDVQVNVPLRWLRPSWLLFLQLLILALFLLALARPAIDAGGPQASRLVLVIDRTASMSARDGSGGTRLDDARSAAIDLIDRVVGGPGGAEACVVGLAHEARSLTGFLRDRAALKAAVRAIEPSDQPGGLGPALRLAGALLTSGDEGEDTGREAAADKGGMVVLFSDGSFPAGELPGLSAGEFRFERAGPPEASATDRDNLGIVAVAARRDYEDPGTVRVFARIQNAASAPASASLVLTLDGEALERRAVTVPASDPQPHATPGQMSLTMEARTTGSGILTLRLARDDLLVADDTASVVLAPAARPRIILVIPDGADMEGRSGGDGPEWLLADPLRELRARSFRILRASAYEQALTSESGLSADLVVFDRVRPSRLPPVPTISFGSGIPLDGGQLASGFGSGTHVLSWDRSSPTLRNVSLDTLFVARPMAFMPASEGAPAVRELARGRDGPLIVEVRNGPARRIIVAFELAQSTWPLDFGFAIFLADGVDYLTLRGEDQVTGGSATFTTSQPAEIEASPGGGGDLVLRGPIEIHDRPGEPGDSRVPLGVLERAGVYRVETERAAPGAEPRWLAVNLLDETESALRTRDALSVSGEPAPTGGAETGPREIWHWFVTIALILLAIEWFLHAWMMRV